MNKYCDFCFCKSTITKFFDRVTGCTYYLCNDCLKEVLEDDKEVL